MKRLIAMLFVATLAAHTAVFADESLFQPVGLQEVEEPGSRFYVAGILGASFATLSTDQQISANDTLFTTGGTLGMAFDLPWRLEVEGRARDPIVGGIAVPGAAGSFEATGGWSTMVNLWRDVEVFDNIGIYMGGGIGAGGYRLGYDASFPGLNTSTAGTNNQTEFAWQAGGGVVWDLTSRLSIDLGYRFFSIGSGTTTITTVQEGNPTPVGTFDVRTGFSASELLLSIRIYEPFRGWL